MQQPPLRKLGVFDLDRSAPFALLDDRFAFERHDWPTRTMLITAAWTVAFTALGFRLGSVRDSTVASLLAEKMSSREKIVITLVAVSAVAAVGTAQMEHTKREPVHLPGAVAHERGKTVRVEITSTRRRAAADEDEALQRAGARLADELEDFSRHLGGVALPTVFVVHRSVMGASEIEIYVTDRSPNAFVPAQDSPVTLLVGRSILDTLSPANAAAAGGCSAGSATSAPAGGSAAPSTLP